MKKLISKDYLLNGINRFKIPFITAIFITIMLLVMINSTNNGDSEETYRLLTNLVFSHISFFFFSITISETFKEGSFKYIFSQIAVYFSTLAITAIFPFIQDYSYFNNYSLANVILPLLAILSLFTFPTLIRYSETKDYKYINAVTKSFLVGTGISIIVSLYFLFTLLVANLLLNLETEPTFILNVIIIITGVIGGSFYLASYPTIEEFAEEEDSESKNTRITLVVNKFFTLPFLFIFSSILILYFLKIVLTRELPNNQLVPISVAYIWIATGLVYSYKTSFKKYIDRWVVKAVILSSGIPFILFYMGILTRINSYGLSVNRLYILTIGFVFTALFINFYRSEIIKISRYILAIFIILSVFTYLPLINFRSISCFDQTLRLDNFLRSGNFIDDEGKFYVDSSNQANYIGLKNDIVQKLNDSYRSCDNSIEKYFSQDEYELIEKSRGVYYYNFEEILIDLR